MLSENFNNYSAYYDLLYQNKNYFGEAEFICDLIKKHAPHANRILELGCGTGSHAVHIAKRGYNLLGIDRSQDMLGLAEEKARNLELSNALTFKQGDLREFSAPDKYDAIISLFDVFSYLKDNSELKQAMSQISSHASDNAILIFDAWYGPSVLTQKPHCRVRRLENEQIRVTRIAEPEMHVQENRCDVNYEIIIQNKINKHIDILNETHPMRFYFDAELDEILSQFNFKRITSAGWFSDKAPTFDTWSALFVYQYCAD